MHAIQPLTFGLKWGKIGPKGKMHSTIGRRERGKMNRNTIVAILAFTAGIAVGMLIALILLMNIMQAEIIMPGPSSIMWL